MYDIIGDIHGYADELVQLLESMGYRRVGGVYRHQQRQAVFCGDFVDRGPQIRDVLEVVRGMVESGAALSVMGNHELNAMAYQTPDPRAENAFLRPHTERNHAQHRQTLEQLSASELSAAIDWFRQLPMWLDLGTLRIVHACWSPPDFATIEAAVAEYGGVTADFLVQATLQGNAVFDAVERVLKGPELQLPEGHWVTDKEGFRRRRIRIRWFDDPTAHTLGSYALPARTEPELLEMALPERVSAVPYDHSASPVLFGHYWLTADAPRPLTHNVGCLDYSVAKGGHLCAYRSDGEARLEPERFVVVPSRNNTR